jgi:poly(3-hydroxybutyrate) depolymerase
LRGTVEGFLETHDVYIADWADARMAPVWLGGSTSMTIWTMSCKMISHVGPGAHVLAVCQPGPPVLAAISMMAEDDDPNRPASMTFMGSPIDARRSPTVPNELAEETEPSTGSRRT